jgi:YVTN family beta-propeller protein
MGACAFTGRCAGQPRATWHLIDTWNIGGDGVWDYLTIDEKNHLLYVARLNRVMVVDTETGKLAGEIGGLQHTHGIALDDKGNRGYVTDGGGNNVVAFDRKTEQILKVLPAGNKPDSIVFEPTHNRVFAFNGKSNNATVIDAGTNAVIGTIPLPGSPEFSVADGAGSVFVNISEPVKIVKIDAQSMKILKTWSIPGCEDPSGLAIDTVHRRLFSTCHNKIMAILDAETGKVVATPAIGDGPDAARYDATDGLVFSTNGESGDMTVIREVTPDQYTILQTIKTEVGGRTLAYDSSNGRIYIVSAKLGSKRPATKDNPRGRGAVLPGSFSIFVYGQ